jgi:uncharacterized protein (DUF1697 family)
MAITKNYVALLRGINVGGKHLVPMKMLAEMFASAGCEQVRTYIQSGNVVFAASPAVAREIAETIGEKIRKRLGHEAPVVLRSAEQFAQIVENNPFGQRKDFSNFSHVLFCADKLSPANVKKLDPQRSPGDEIVCKGQEVFLWLPNGAGKSKLTNAYFDAKLETICTQRNWRTVVKLNEML